MVTKSNIDALRWSAKGSGGLKKNEAFYGAGQMSAAWYARFVASLRERPQIYRSTYTLEADEKSSGEALPRATRDGVSNTDGVGGDKQFRQSP